MRKPYYGGYGSYRRDPDDPFEPVTVYLPKSLAAILKSYSDKRGLPVSRLVCYAVDNELDTAHPFNYECDLPESPFVEYAYAAEASRMIEYLERFPSGTGRDVLMLARRDMSIPNRTELMLAYRELLETQMVEEYMPVRTKFKFNRDYKYTRLVGYKPQDVRKKKYKQIEGESTSGDNGSRAHRDTKRQLNENPDEID